LPLLALVTLTCHQVILTAPPGSTITLIANPEFIPANGGVSVISALIFEPAGTPVADGTVVQFFTNLGRIDEQGRTNDGVVRVNLVSDSRSGTATVRAFSGGASSGGGVTPSPTPSGSPGTGGSGGGSGAAGSTTVVIGSALPALVLMTANPQRVVGDPRTSTIRAFVYDDKGNPLFNVPVIFAITAGVSPSPAPSASPSATPAPSPDAGTDFLVSRGAPLFTDGNGVAEDVLIVRTSPTAPQRTITVTATTSNNKTGSVQVIIN
jgi:hypothetical protein